MQEATRERLRDLANRLKEITNYRLALTDGFKECRLTELEDVIEDHEQKFTEVEEVQQLLLETAETWEL